MKQTFLKFSGKKLFAAAFLSASLFLTSLAGNAAFAHNNIEILSGGKSNVEVAANTSDALFFKVNINNEKADRFTLTLKNDAGDILFSKSFSEAKFQKQFKVLKGEQDNANYYFTITSDNKNLEDSYVITTTLRTVNDVTINKL